MQLGPFAWLVRAMIWMAGIGVFVILLASGSTTRLDNAFYDLHMRHWHYSPANDVVIVAIDPKSLDALGHWPWPRSTHAKLIDRLHAAGVRGIGMDVTMSSSEVPATDELLAQAVHRAGNVVMPVYAESIDLNGQLQETLPIPTLVRNVATLGHVDVAKDDDDIVRGAFLKAGLGKAYWPSFALALYELSQPSAKPPSGLLDPDSNDASPYLWMRDDYVLLRYAGPAGSFGRLSYVDVLNGNAPTALLKGRWALIGATAEGMGDMIRTPDSVMPGVEYQANLLESLQHGRLITPLGFLAQFVVGTGMLAIPLLLYGLPGLRQAWRAALAAFLFAIALSVCLLRIFHQWWPPAACMLIISAEFLIVSLIMLRQKYRSRR
jgi:CHASE2 domain-containing sensor protein